MNPEASSDSEEEILVYAEFEDSVNIGMYRSIHVLGINETKPIIQMDDTFFTGKFENPLGTYMFFEQDPVPHCADRLFDKMPEKSLKYLLKTRKFLNMEHAYISPNGDSEHIQNNLQQTEETIDPVNFKTVQEALDMFKDKWNPNNTPEVKNESK